MTEKPEQSKPSIPAWRAELSEKVREIRARKADQNTPSQSPSEQCSDLSEVAYTSLPAPLPIVDLERGKIGTLTKAKFSVSPAPSLREVAGVSGAESTSIKRSNSKLVQDALSRVQRASENARRSGLPRIEPSRPAAITNSLTTDREATARVLEQPIPELEPTPVIPPRPLMQERRITQPLHSPAPVSSIAVVTQPLILEEVTDNSQSEIAVPAKEIEVVKQLDEDHCLDYLEAEVERVDRKLHEIMGFQNGVGFATHVLINLIDFAVIGLSCAPFLIIIKVLNVKFEDPGTMQAATGICLLIAGFYLTLTQILGNRTFGMMATRTRLATASTLEKPSSGKILARTFGYLPSFAIALLGFFWIALDSQSRSWHDRISGTVVINDN